MKSIGFSLLMFALSLRYVKLSSVRTLTFRTNSNPSFISQFLIPTGDFLYGIQPVLGCLRAKRRQPYRLFIKPRGEVDKNDSLYAWSKAVSVCLLD